MRHAGGEPSDCRQSLGVPQLFHRGDPHVGLSVHLVPGGGKLLAHDVEGGGQLGEFVAAPQIERSAQVAGPHAACFFDQLRQGISHDRNPDNCDNQAAPDQQDRADQAAPRMALCRKRSAPSSE